LVTLQWGYAGEDKDFSGIVSNGFFYKEIEFLIKKRADYCWHFRLHPSQMRGREFKRAIFFIQNLAKNNLNVTWKNTSAVPLISVANACDAHLTLSSMSSYEVAAIGKPTMILCPKMREDGKYVNYFNDLLAEGYALKADFDNNLIEKWIDNSSKMKPRALSKQNDKSWEIFIERLKNQQEKINNLKAS
jgi:hypothetical protein